MMAHLTSAGKRLKEYLSITGDIVSYIVIVATFLFGRVAFYTLVCILAMGCNILHIREPS